MTTWVETEERVFGQRIRELRIGAGLRQEDLARLANVSRSAVAGLEGGKGSTLATAMKVLRALGRDDWFASLTVPSAAFNPLDLLDDTPSPTPRRQRVRRRGQTPAAP